MKYQGLEIHYTITSTTGRAQQPVFKHKHSAECDVGYYCVSKATQPSPGGAVTVVTVVTMVTVP